MLMHVQGSCDYYYRTVWSFLKMLHRKVNMHVKKQCYLICKPQQGAVRHDIDTE